MSPKTAVFYLVKIMLLTFTILLSTMIGSTVSGLAHLNAELTPQEAAQTLPILLAVHFVNALLLSWVLVRARWRGWRLVVTVGVLYFGITTFMAQLETLYYGDAMKIDTPLLLQILVANFIASIIIAPTAVFLFKKMRGNSQFITWKVSAWQWKLPVLALAYVIIYYLFGYYVAWQSSDVRLYYTGSTQILPFGVHMMDVFRTSSDFVIFQLFRGLLWTGLVLLILQCCKGKKWELILCAGLLLSLLLTLQLFFPNPFMPANVRMPHFVETSTSTFLFGVLAATLLIMKPLYKEKNLAAELQW